MSTYLRRRSEVLDALTKMTRERPLNSAARGRVIDELEAKYGEEFVAACWRDLMEYRQEQRT